MTFHSTAAITALGEEMVSLWGRDVVKPWPASALAGVDIPDTSKRLLTEFGLPDFWVYSVRFLREETLLPRLNTSFPQYRVLGVYPQMPPEEWESGERKQAALAWDFAHSQEWPPDRIPSVCLDESRGGCVLYTHHKQLTPGRIGMWFYVEPPQEPEEWINSSVAILYDRIPEPPPPWNVQFDPLPAPLLQEYETAALQIVDKTEQDMRALDEAAMADGETGWWPADLEEFRTYGIWG